MTFKNPLQDLAEAIRWKKRMVKRNLRYATLKTAADSFHMPKCKTCEEPATVIEVPDGPPEPYATHVEFLCTNLACPTFTETL